MPTQTPRILVVEDHAVTREPLVRLLRYEGFDAVPAANGLEALAALNAGAVDLLLLDLMMPKMDGVKLLEAVRGDERWQKLPVIVLTATVEGSQLARVRELNVSGIITKARFELTELLDRIRQCLAGAGAPTLPQDRTDRSDEQVAA